MPSDISPSDTALASVQVSKKVINWYLGYLSS